MKLSLTRITGATMLKALAMNKMLAITLILSFTFATILAQAPATAGQVQGGQFVRIGLNKSVVVRLPANAQDVLIGNPAIVDAVVRTQRMAYLFAKKAGQTNVFFFDSKGRQILNLDIEVARDMKALQKLFQRVMPGNRITVETVNENVVLGGVAKSPAQARLAVDLAAKYTDDEKKVLSTISVAGLEQVALKVKIAEVQREVLKQFGIDTNKALKLGSKAVQLLTVSPFSLNGGPLTVGSAPPFSTSFGSPGYGISTANGSGAVLRAMERDGYLKTLAEPTLTAVSGESAKFLAGGEFPIPVGVDNGQISIEFKKFGVGLGFTPVVLTGGRISLKLNTEVSELSPENAIILSSISIPSLTVRRAETTVELPSGGSLAMAGLIQEKTQQAINGLPGMKNLPILGALFRSRDYQQKLSELAIIVTPYIVRPVNEKQLVAPTDRSAVATDTQTILFGRLNKVFGSKGVSGETYHGNVGFIVE